MKRARWAILIIAGLIGIGGLVVLAVRLSPEGKPTQPQTAIATDTLTPIQTPSSTPRQRQTAPLRNEERGETPGNCATAVAMGLSAVEAAEFRRLDRDQDGVACYGD